MVFEYSRRKLITKQLSLYRNLKIIAFDNLQFAPFYLNYVIAIYMYTCVTILPLYPRRRYVAADRKNFRKWAPKPSRR